VQRRGDAGESMLRERRERAEREMLRRERAERGRCWRERAEKGRC
jgi:hypothetical protein